VARNVRQARHARRHGQGLHLPRLDEGVAHGFGREEEIGIAAHDADLRVRCPPGAPKLEDLHYDLGSQDLIAQPLAPNLPFAVTNHWTTKGDIVRVGVNYKVWLGLPDGYALSKPIEMPIQSKAITF
jgi:hypothetical protein